MKTKRFYLAILLWLALASAGILFVLQYDFTPATLIKTASSLHRRLCKDCHPYELYVFLHPYCPCSSATLHELEALSNRLEKEGNTKVKIKIVFFKPGGDIKEWKKSSLWAHANKLKNVDIIIDQEGKLIKHYQAETSGETMLFDADGNCLFDGGITISRGHEGDAPGKEYIYRLVSNKRINELKSPIFGCPIFGSED
jgi:hypothetical protein